MLTITTDFKGYDNLIGFQTTKNLKWKLDKISILAIMERKTPGKRLTSRYFIYVEKTSAILHGAVRILLHLQDVIQLI
jgi:phage anti-repressor protein